MGAQRHFPMTEYLGGGLFGWLAFLEVRRTIASCCIIKTGNIPADITVGLFDLLEANSRWHEPPGSKKD